MLSSLQLPTPNYPGKGKKHLTSSLRHIPFLSFTPSMLTQEHVKTDMPTDLPLTRRTKNTNNRVRNVTTQHKRTKTHTKCIHAEATHVHLFIKEMGYQMFREAWEIMKV